MKYLSRRTLNGKLYLFWYLFPCPMFTEAEVLAMTTFPIIIASDEEEDEE